MSKIILGQDVRTLKETVSVCLSFSLFWVSIVSLGYLSVHISVYLSKLFVCLYVCLFICLSVCMSSFLSACLSVYFYICLSVCLSVCLSICMYVYLSVHLNFCLSVCLSNCLSICLSICIFVCLSIICLFICLTMCLPIFLSFLRSVLSVLSFHPLSFWSPSILGEFHELDRFEGPEVEFADEHIIRQALRNHPIDESRPERLRVTLQSQQPETVDHLFDCQLPEVFVCRNIGQGLDDPAGRRTDLD